ncbi:MAG: hypothetical protein M0R05_03385 [Bacilli bacterium]|nr:hypothetical protein [Bacilli bacterium]MDD4076678.1 hypothetical protein [Bacilli bacterium]MDD4388836.1 hypothetical protein [Bacilli bacterium]
MSDKKIKRKFFDNFNKCLENYEIRDNYSVIVQKLEDNGITLVRPEAKRLNTFAYIYTILTIFLCVLTGLIGFSIGGNSKRAELLNPGTKQYLETHTEIYYDQPIMTIYYSEHDMINIYVGLVKDDDELVIHYFYQLIFINNNPTVSFKNLNNNKEVFIVNSFRYGDLSVLITINNGDKIMCTIKDEEKTIHQYLIAYHDIYLQLVEK